MGHKRIENNEHLKQNPQKEAERDKKLSENASENTSTFLVKKKF